MSVKGIRAVIRCHTGANANDDVKITHEEVVTMMRAAEDHCPVGRVTLTFKTSAS